MYGEERDFFSSQFQKRELKFRRQLMREFNKTEEDFDTLSGFNAYLETIEDFIWNLTNGEKEKETWSRINDFLKVHSFSGSSLQHRQQKMMESRPKKKLRIQQISKSTMQDHSGNFQPAVQNQNLPKPLRIVRKKDVIVTKELVELRKKAAGWNDIWWDERISSLARDLPF